MAGYCDAPRQVSSESNEAEFEVEAPASIVSDIDIDENDKMEQLISTSAHSTNANAPIHRLPFEMLSAIFVECCRRGFYKKFDKAPQLVLAQVCSAWRKIAHGTPHLWTVFAVSFRTEEERVSVGGRRRRSRGHLGMAPSWHARMMTSWLSRSGALPLHVSIKHGRVPMLVDMVGRLGSFCHRIQTLVLAVPLLALRPLSLLPGLPLLTSLTLSLSKLETGFSNSNSDSDSDSDMYTEDEYDSPPSVDFQSFSLLRNSPRLREVNLYGLAESEELVLKALHLISQPSSTAQLKTIELVLATLACTVQIDPSPYLDILKQSSSSLVSCSLRCPRWITDLTADDLDPITFASLETLNLIDWHDECESQFLNLLTLPALRHLRVNHAQHGGFSDSHFALDVVRLQQRSCAPLVSLELNSVFGLTPGILAILASFPTISSLRLVNCLIDTRVLMQGLEYHDATRAPRAPVLQSLCFKDMAMKRGTDRYIADMVESRFRAARAGVGVEAEGGAGNGNGKKKRADRVFGVRMIVRLTVVFEKSVVGEEVIERLRRCGIRQLAVNEEGREKKRKGTGYSIRG